MNGSISSCSKIWAEVTPILWIVPAWKLTPQPDPDCSKWRLTDLFPQPLAHKCPIYYPVIASASALRSQRYCLKRTLAGSGIDASSYSHYREVRPYANKECRIHSGAKTMSRSFRITSYELWFECLKNQNSEASTRNLNGFCQEIICVPISSFNIYATHLHNKAMSCVNSGASTGN